MSEEEFIKLMCEIPKDKTNKSISTYGSIDVDDLREAVKRLKKVPDYNDLLKENKQLKEQNEEIKQECLSQRESFHEKLDKAEHIAQNYKDRYYDEKLKFKKQLEQRDEAIDEAINKLQLIIVIGFDYDGFNQVGSLKTLIDELINYAKESRDILTNIQRR